MRIGYETIIWGIQLDNEIKRVLDTITEAGFEGVEFVQRPDALGVKNVNELLKLLNERGLVFLSLAGGALKERMSFCGDVRPEYMYMEHWDLVNTSLATRLGFIPALHPRAFTPVRRFTDIIPLLEEIPKLRLLLDTAHLTVAGDDLLSVIQQAQTRIAAIHLKDWTPEFGRSSHRYVRGFTSLGQGNVDLESVLRLLQKITYNKWIVAELDNPQIDPYAGIYQSAQWLAGRGLLPRPSEKLKTSNSRRLWTFPREQGRCSPNSEARFREALMFAANSKPTTFYNSLALAFNEILPSKLISIWTYSPAQGHLALLTSTHPIFPEDTSRSTNN